MKFVIEVLTDKVDEGVELIADDSGMMSEQYHLFLQRYRINPEGVREVEGSLELLGTISKEDVKRWAKGS